MSVKKRDNLSTSPWIRRFLPLLPKRGFVLDLAAGGGRHSLCFLAHGHHVTSLDRKTGDLRALEATCSKAERQRFEIVEADLEDGSSWPLGKQRFDIIVVVNYLHRPLFSDLLAALAPGGVLLYDTFAVGQEVYGKPENPDFLLKSGELLAVARGRLQIVAYEHGLIDDGNGPAVKQRIAAVDGETPVALTTS